MHVEFSQRLGSGAVEIARFTGRPAVIGSPSPALRLPWRAAAMLAASSPLRKLEVCSDDARGSSEDVWEQSSMRTKTRRLARDPHRAQRPKANELVLQVPLCNTRGQVACGRQQRDLAVSERRMQQQRCTGLTTSRQRAYRHRPSTQKPSSGTYVHRQPSVHHTPQERAVLSIGCTMPCGTYNVQACRWETAKRIDGPYSGDGECGQGFC